MKKLLALLLAAVLTVAMFGCAAKPAEKEEGSESGYALAEASMPDLPQKPSWDDYQKKFDELASKNLGDEERTEQEDALYDEYETAQNAYDEALQALRGSGVETDAGFAAFTDKLAASVLDPEENSVLSPVNLYLALSMLTELTDGETRQQVLDLLGSKDTAALRDTCRSIWENLYLDDGESKTLLANAVFLNKGFRHEDAPLETLAKNYYSDAYQLPMGTAEADKAVQDWLNDHTGKLLEDSVKNLETDPQTALMLASALYFKGAWLEKFEESATAEETFYAADGSEQTADFMHLSQNQSVVRGDGFTAATLDFREQGGMTFLLPDEGVSLDSLVQSGALQAALQTDESGDSEAEVHWSVPKFDAEATMQLKDVLQALGVTDVFDPDAADFMPLTGGADGDPLYVSSVEHAARVKVDETGCEAAAYTVILVDAAAMDPDDLPVVEMNLNRPFLFVITGVDGLPLFVGAVNTMQ